MREGIISKRYFNLRHNNSGFTLVELVVVLVLMAILLSVSIGFGLGWYDWSQFKHENAIAEEIFFAAQNQLTELDSSGALDNKIVKPLLKTGTDQNSYHTDIVLSKTILEQIQYTKSVGTDAFYSWDTVWKLNQNPEKEMGTILRLKADAGDYKKYLNGNLLSNDDTSKIGTKILFDLVTPYISDTGVLNGTILLEFSPDAAQVFSVCYSDGVDTFLYKNESTEGSKTFFKVDDRTLSTREQKKIGYYSVEELAQRLKGGAKLTAHIGVELKNEETLTLIITDKSSGSDKIKDEDTLVFNVYDGSTQGKNCIMSFNIRYGDIKDYTSLSYNNALKSASKEPLDITCNMLEGVYKGKQTLGFRLPVWKQNDKIYMIFDAADVQAETSVYSRTKAFSASYDEEKDTAFRNTFSFYRFGFAETNSYISVGVQIRKFDYSTTREIRSNNECSTFASYVKKNDEAKIGIKNLRHFYNIRYETDYKRVSSRANTFVLQNDLSWAEFTGKNADGINYFLNSYSLSKSSGINYDGKSYATKSVRSDSSDYLDTSVYPFPGFRKLDTKDVFTQELAYGEESEEDASLESYTISDLQLSVAANIVYGIYGENIKNQCAPGNVEDYSAVLGIKTEADDSSGSNAARAGKLPLGLFAENLGTISNINLNRHIVYGLEKINDTIVYTCMVGGFTGNNIGKLENLMLLDNETNSMESPKANISKVIGRTDVGGILGRESFVIASSGVDVILKNLTNYAKVMGMENVGGIAGRAYVNYSDDSLKNYDRYKYYHDGYSITDDDKSMSGQDVVRAESVTFDKCTNKGYVYGLSNDESLAEEIIDEQIIKDIKSSFIGGIVGGLIDGLMYDDNSLVANGINVLEDYDNYLNGSDSKVKIKDCSSFVVYELNDLTKLSDTEKHPSLLNDNYVGGLIGYGRLAAIENCNAIPDETILENGVSRSFVFGNRYVGGVIGCSDMCRFDKGKSDDSASEEENEYTVTNYNNVIGRFIVGGVAGANGIGDIDKNKFSFREPSKNLAGPATQPSDVNGYNLMRNALNKGVVLALRSEEAFADGIVDGWKAESDLQEGEISYKDVYFSESLTGLCGGIVGMNVSGLKECDNIQSDEVKNFEMRLIAGVDLYDKTAEQIELLTKASNYGGSSVGGIAGYVAGTGYINKTLDGSTDKYSSKVDAVVFGQDYVGGIFGTSLRDGSFVENCFPYKNGDSSRGNLVIGRDCVGGIAGRLSSEYISSTIEEASQVKGRNAVGGIAGSITTSKDIAISFDPEGMDNVMKVQGIAYIGGFAGICDSEETKFKGVSGVQIDLDDVDVNGKYFVGGVAGCLGGSGENAAYIADSQSGFKIGSNVTVNADIFAGGISGLFTIDTENENFYKVSEDRKSNNSNLYWLVLNKLSSGDGYLGYQDVFKNVVNGVNGTKGDVTAEGISNQSIFVKGTSEVELDFTDNSVESTVSESSFSGNIYSKLYAGGLFGYVPNGLKVKVISFRNNGNICVTDSVSEAMVDEAAGNSVDIKYSYLGGVIGRIPSGMTLIDCINEKTGTYYEGGTNFAFYSSKATYLGGLTEVNAGVISGKGSSEETGEVQYLLSDTDREYDSIKVGAFAGVNGTKYTNISFTEKGEISDDSTGVIKYCKNIGNITVNNNESASAGIVVSIGGNSAIFQCVNEGVIASSGGFSSGIAGELSSGGLNDDSSVFISNNSNTGNISGASGAAGILLSDLGGMNTYLVDNTNLGMIDSDFGGASGIIYGVESDNHSSADSGVCLIKDCINHGSVDSGNKCYAAGILGYSTVYTLLEGCVNTGVITQDGLHPVDMMDEKLKKNSEVAGIVCAPGEKGELKLCRNYGTGLYYGITKEKAAKIHFCFDASNSEKHIGDVYNIDSNPENKYANYYFGEADVDNSERRFKAWREYDENDTNDDVDLTFSMFSSTADTTSTMQEGDNRSANWKNDDGKHMKYVIQPVKNKQTLPCTNAAVDAFKIVWDNCTLPDDSSDVDILYSIKIYNNSDDNNPDNDLVLTVSRMKNTILYSDGLKVTEFDLTPLNNGFIILHDGNKESIPQPPSGFSIGNISRIEIIIENCTRSDDNNMTIDTVGIRTVMLKEKGTNSFRIPQAHDAEQDLPVDPYAGISDVRSMVNLLSDYVNHSDIYEKESKLYAENDSSTTYKIMLRKLEVGIDGLEKNPYDYPEYYIDYNPYETTRHRWKVYEELDQKYVEIFKPIMDSMY